jgi:hypothetical protein
LISSREATYEELRRPPPGALPGGEILGGPPPLRLSSPPAAAAVRPAAATSTTHGDRTCPPTSEGPPSPRRHSDGVEAQRRRDLVDWALVFHGTGYMNLVDLDDIDLDDIIRASY